MKTIQCTNLIMLLMLSLSMTILGCGPTEGTSQLPAPEGEFVDESDPLEDIAE